VVQGPESMKFEVNGKLGKYVSGKDITHNHGDIGVEDRYASWRSRAARISCSRSRQDNVSRTWDRGRCKGVHHPTRQKVGRLLEEGQGSYRHVHADDDAEVRRRRESKGRTSCRSVANHSSEQRALASEVDVR